MRPDPRLTPLSPDPQSVIEGAPQGARLSMSVTHAVASPMRRAQFPIFVAAATCAFAGVWMSVPLAAVILTEQGASPALVGLYAAAVWISALVTAPASPWLAGWAGGALRLHQAAGLTSALALLGLATNPPLALWFVFGGVLGMASCLTWTTADAIAGAMAPPGREGQFLGIYQTFISAAIGGGPAVLWLSGVQAGAFAASAGLMLAGFGLTLMLREVRGAVPRRMRLSLVRLRPVAMMMLAPAGAAMLCGALEGTAGAVFPVQGLALGLGAAAAASIVVATGFGNMLAQYPVGMLADRFGTHRALLGCAVAVALGSLLWPVLAPDWGIWPVLAVWGGAAGAIYTLGMVRAVQRFAGPARALGMAGLNTAYLLGGAIGAPLGGLLLEAVPGWGLPLAVSVVALGGGLALSLAALRRGG
ncbi:MFS transporter [Sediminicoccus sp. KRV36]|uniref:MFS transporter n=1 Tax=Sediminicoccus sp. KRV36 TaxID=3133721 RepID=UPI00200D97F8|nr:MFS transporter [Sediminicoccus rosea]UPY37540.1 MFS transporter [Sediminicoccus rosea]